MTQEAATVAKLQAQLEAAVEMRQMQQDHSAAMDAVRQEQLADTRSEIERSREASVVQKACFRGRVASWGFERSGRTPMG